MARPLFIEPTEENIVVRRADGGEEELRAGRVYSTRYLAADHVLALIATGQLAIVVDDTTGKPLSRGPRIVVATRHREPVTFNTVASRTTGARPQPTPARVDREAIAAAELEKLTQFWLAAGQPIHAARHRAATQVAEAFGVTAPTQEIIAP